jgi:hypothetical protein
MSSNTPIHLGAQFLTPGDHAECEDDTCATWRCCRCKKFCTLVPDPEWPAFKASSCCKTLPYRVDMERKTESATLRLARMSTAASKAGDAEMAIGLLDAAMASYRDAKEVA